MMKTFIFITFLHASCSLRFSLRSTAPDGPKLEILDGPEGLRVVRNFTNLEKSKKYPTRMRINLDSLQIEKAEDACSASMIVQTLNFGFGCKVNNFMNQILLAAYGHYTIAFGRNHKFMRQWEAHFKETLPICNSSRRSQLASAAGGFFKGLSVEDRKFATDMKRAVYKKIYQLNDDTLNRIEENMKQIGFSSEVKTIGVHIRRGDKVKEAEPIDDEKYAEEIQHQETKMGDLYKESNHAWGKADLDVYYSKKAAQIKTEAAKYPDVKTVYLASDDPLAHGAIKKALGDEYKIIGAAAEEWTKEKEASQYSDEQSMLNLLTDVEALKRSEVFIGTASSNMARMIYFMRDAEKKSVSLDEDWLKRPM